MLLLLSHKSFGEKEEELENRAEQVCAGHGTSE